MTDIFQCSKVTIHSGYRARAPGAQCEREREGGVGE